ncbi:hypothetical protein ACXHQ9_16490, partial [Vibrio cincinnatiensis]
MLQSWSYPFKLLLKVRQYNTQASVVFDREARLLVMKHSKLPSSAKKPVLLSGGHIRRCQICRSQVFIFLNGGFPLTFLTFRLCLQEIRDHSEKWGSMAGATHVYLFQFRGRGVVGRG